MNHPSAHEAVLDSSKSVEGHARLVPLEACRGAAACVVFFHHFLMGFYPGLQEKHGLLHLGKSIGGFFLSPLINGAGAVIFFFVLSGYVLPYRYFRNGRMAIVTEGVLKRLFRLAGPCALSTGTAALLLLAGLYFYGPASAISHSIWLFHMGGSSVDPHFHASLFHALWEGGFLTFFTGESTYNVNLWTMRFEFLGSLLIYALAAFLFHEPKRAGFILLLVLVVVAPFNALYLAFPLGTGLSWLHARREPRLRASTALLLLALSFYLFAYFFPVRLFKPFALFTPFISEEQLFDSLGILASLFLIHALMGWSSLFRALDKPWGAFLGKLSFPLYLVHLLVILSWSSWLFVRLHGRLPAVEVFWITLATTVPWVILGAVLLSWFDQIWLRSINRLFKRKRD